VDDGVCLKLGPVTILLDDRVDPYDPYVSNVQMTKPGRYAVVGIRWAEPFIGQYDMVGLSRPHGDLWVVDLSAGVVTDLGVWSVTSPYAHRFVPSDPEQGAAPSPGATLAIKGRGQLV
jgi:hypothetical protein